MERVVPLGWEHSRLTEEIRRVWNPHPERAEADRLRVVADDQYLKAVVENDLGVEIELDQRSEGFQWLVSFFVVFFAEAAGKHENAILLLDEPGLSLHAVKQRDSRETISRLAASNQTLYTTHSPFLVGPGELDLVRVVEMRDRTKKDEKISAGAQEAFWRDVEKEVLALLRAKGPMYPGDLPTGLPRALLNRGSDVEMPLAEGWLRFMLRAMAEAGRPLAEKDGRFRPG